MMGDICDDLGLSNASPITKTLMTSILVLAKNKEETSSMSALDFYNKRQDLSKHLDSRFRVRLPHHGQVIAAMLLMGVDITAAESGVGDNTLSECFDLAIVPRIGLGGFK